MRVKTLGSLSYLQKPHIANPMVSFLVASYGCIGKEMLIVLNLHNRARSGYEAESIGYPQSYVLSVI